MLVQATYRTALKWLIAIVLVSTSWSDASGTTWYPADPSFASVQAAINSASDGDTISIPAGSATWTTTLTINKAITLQGSGSALTLITNNVSGGLRPGTLMVITLVPGKVTRLTGFQVPKTPLGSISGAAISVGGASDRDGSAFRVDHCVFGQQAAYCFWLSDVFGVADHNTFTAGPSHIPFEIQNNRWGGGTNNYGDGSWADDSYYGTNKFFFMEDNTFTCSNSTYPEALVDSLAGARYVVRNNIFMNASVINHGTESGNRQRGGRVMEVYNNVFQGNCAFWINIRSGTAVIWGNDLKGVTNFGGLSTTVLEAKRVTWSFTPWGQANGKNAWDSNVAGGPFASGTATGGGSLTLTDSRKNWTVNQWAGNGYVLLKTSVASGYCGSQIVSNTATTLTIQGNDGYSAQISFTAGDTYEIRRVNEALDQPGKGKGSLVTGTYTTPLVPSGWFDEVTDPIYQWGNTSSDKTANFRINANESTIRANEHYFSVAKPGYTPYTYPHPLVSGQVPAPTNLTVVQ